MVQFHATDRKKEIPKGKNSRKVDTLNIVFGVPQLP